MPWLLSWPVVATQRLDESKTTEGPTGALPVAEKETSPEMGWGVGQDPQGFVAGMPGRKTSTCGPLALTSSQDLEGFVCLGGPALYMGCLPAYFWPLSDT